MRANIEELKDSIIDSDIVFTGSPFRMIQFRRNNLTITQMIWITKRPVIDCGNTLYNPKALILLFLN